MEDRERRRRASWARRLDSALYSRSGREAARWLRDFGGLLSPTACVHCGAVDVVLCGQCRARLRHSTVRPLRAEAAAEALPLDGFDVPLPVVAAGHYGQELSSCLLAFKDRGRLGLRNVLAPVLANALHRLVTEMSADLAWYGVPDRPILLVPVPGRASSQTRRGYFPVGELTQWMARRDLLPPGCRVTKILAVREPWTALLPNGVVRDATDRVFGGDKVSNHRAQKQKGRRSRTSVRGTMRLADHWARAAPNGLFGQPCLIIDDVLTTGATLSEAHRVLTQAGAVVLGAAVAAAAHDPRSRSAQSETEICGQNLDSWPG